MNKPIVFTTRVLSEIWDCIQTAKVIADNPNAPSKQDFLEYYTQTNPPPTLFWDDVVNGLSYSYDLRINRVTVTPPARPFSRHMTILNNRLKEVLNPDLLATSANWKEAWCDAAKRLTMPTLQFLIEQGFDANTPCSDYSTAIYHAITPYGGSFTVVKLLVESGANLTSPYTVEELIQAGKEGVSSSLEAMEAATIATYLQAIVKDN